MALGRCKRAARLQVLVRHYDIFPMGLCRGHGIRAADRGEYRQAAGVARNRILKLIRIGSLTQIKVILSGQAENLARPMQVIIIWLRRPNKSKAYKNAQLFCACHRYSDDHACDFVGTI